MENQPGDADADDLGVKLYEQGKVGEAEQWWREAAAAGDTDAMYYLGILLYRQGKKDEFEQWWRKAAAAGDAEVMFFLGVRLYEQGKKDEGEQWLRKAAAAGDAEAMGVLGDLLIYQAEATAEHGRISGRGVYLVDEAEQWLRKSVAAGNARSMYYLGTVLRMQGKKDEAKKWRREAAAAEVLPWWRPRFYRIGSGLHQSWVYGPKLSKGGGSARQWVTETGEKAADLADGIAGANQNPGPR
jgi:TPR repeat protein